MEKKFNNIDDLLRKTLGNYEQKPQAGVWKKISSSLVEGNIFNFLSDKTTLFTAGLIMVLLLIFIFIYIIDLPPIDQGYVKRISQLNTTKYSNDSMDKQDDGNIATKHDTIEFNENFSDEPDGIRIDDNSKQFGNAIQTDKFIIPKENIDMANNDDTESMNPVALEKYLIAGFYHSLVSITFAENLLTQSLNRNPVHFVLKRTQNTLFPGSAIYQNVIVDYGKKSGFIYGFNLIPELLFAGKGDPFKSFGAEITGRYIKNDYYLETGAGLSISENDGLYEIDYDQYDSIGYYFKVTSFAIDQISGQPVFNTDIESVYDTVNYSLREKTKNKYTYLHLPLYGGVKFYELKRLSFNLQAGIIYSVLIHQKESSPDYFNENATRITVTNETSARVSSNWTLAASLGVQYQLRPRLSLNIEPMLKYYIKPVYMQIPENKYTIGVGIRAGFYFKF